MRPATAPRMVKGSISKCVVVGTISASYSAMYESFSSFTSKYSTRPLRRKSSKVRLPLLSCYSIIGKAALELCFAQVGWFGKTYRDVFLFHAGLPAFDDDHWTTDTATIAGNVDCAVVVIDVYAHELAESPCSA